MPVPDTNTFSLQDVCNVVGGNTLQEAFNNAIEIQFDPNYIGHRDRLYNFRNYGNNFTIINGKEQASGSYYYEYQQNQALIWGEFTDHTIMHTTTYSNSDNTNIKKFRTFIKFDLSTMSGTLYDFKLILPLISKTTNGDIRVYRSNHSDPISLADPKINYESVDFSNSRVFTGNYVETSNNNNSIPEKIEVYATSSDIPYMQSRLGSYLSICIVEYYDYSGVSIPENTNIDFSFSNYLQQVDTINNKPMLALKF